MTQILVPAKTKTNKNIFISISSKDVNLSVITLYNKFNCKDYDLFSYPTKENVSLEVSLWKKVVLDDSTFYYQEI
jgi:hypothetical protein